MLLEVYFKVIFVAHGEHAVLFLLGGDGGGHGFADAADGYVRMQRKRARAGAFVYGNGGDVRVHFVHPFAKPAVAAYAVYGYAEGACDEGIEHKLRRKHAVHLNEVVLGIHGVGKRIARHLRGAVVSGKNHAVKRFVKAEHHGIRMACPAAIYAGVFRQLRGVQIACAVMRILNHYFFHARVMRAFAGGGDLAGHLVGKIVIIMRNGALCLVPVNYARGTFYIRADKQFFHRCFSLTFYYKMRGFAPRGLKNHIYQEIR